MLTIIITGLVLIFGVVDTLCYRITKYPERMKLKWLPFVGGPIGLYLYGRDE